MYWKYSRGIRKSAFNRCFLTRLGIINLWSLVVHSELRKKQNSSGYDPAAHSLQLCPCFPNPNLSEYTMQATAAGNLHILSYLLSQSESNICPLSLFPPTLSLALAPKSLVVPIYFLLKELSSLNYVLCSSVFLLCLLWICCPECLSLLY